MPSLFNRGFYSKIKLKNWRDVTSFAHTEYLLAGFLYSGISTTCHILLVEWIHSNFLRNCDRNSHWRIWLFSIEKMETVFLVDFNRKTTSLTANGMFSMLSKCSTVSPWNFWTAKNSFNFYAGSFFSHIEREFRRTKALFRSN